MTSKELNEISLELTDDSMGDIEVVRRLREHLQNKPRDLLLFDMVTQSGVMLEDLLPLRVKDLQGLEIGDVLPMRERSSYNRQPPVITRTILTSFKWYIEKIDPSADDYIFRSRKGGKPLTMTSVSHIARKWFESAGIKGQGGIKSLRRIWAVHYKAPLYGSSKSEAEKGIGRRFKPIAGSTLGELVFRELLKAIVSGRLQPGERLIAEKVAREMNVSTVPVREAMTMLRSMGLISLKRRENIVNQLTQKEFGETTEMRLCLEALAVKHAAVSCSEKTLLLLQDLHSQLIHATAIRDFHEILNVNRRFHFTVYEGAGMPNLLQTIKGLWAKISPYLYLLIKEVHQDLIPSQRTIEIHEGILDGVMRRDPKEASKWIRKDILWGKRLYGIALDHLLKK